MWVTGMKSCPLEKQPMPLAVEPSLQLQHLPVFHYIYLIVFIYVGRHTVHTNDPWQFVNYVVFTARSQNINRVDYMWAPEVSILNTSQMTDFESFWTRSFCFSLPFLSLSCSITCYNSEEIKVLPAKRECHQRMHMAEY